MPVVRRARLYEGLTAEGELVLAHAHRLLREVESLHQELHSRIDAPRGRLQIGAVPTALPLAARFAARLRVRHHGIEPVLRSLSSPEIEVGLENLSLDLALGYTGRSQVRARSLQSWPQYEEAYFLVQREDIPGTTPPGAAITWREAATLPLVMLTPEMHNRSIVEEAMRSASAQPQPALETNSVLALVTALGDGTLAAVLPGALLDVATGLTRLHVHPLVEPAVRTPIGFMTHKSARATPALRAALAIAQDAQWLGEVAAHSGSLNAAA